MKNLKIQPLFSTLLASAVMACGAASAQESGGLNYGGEREDLMNFPIPPSEQSLQTVIAEPWYKVSDDGIQL